MSVFPLSLVPFEEYMLVDDRPTHPMQFFYRLRFSGRIDQDLFSSAVESTLTRHPFFTATVRRRWLRWEWVPSDASPQLVWLDKEPADDFPQAAHLDLQREAGMRITVSNGQDSADVVLQFHHSCCDGLGADQFVGDLLTVYANSQRPSEEQFVLTPLENDLLKNRARFGLSRRQCLKLARKQLVGLKGVRQFYQRSPQPLVPHQLELIGDSVPADYPSRCVHRFDRNQTASIRSAAMRLGVAVNDLLVGILFAAIHDWRRRHSYGHPSDWIRFSVPLSMRRPGNENMPAANVVSMIFLDRRASDWKDENELVRSVHEEMNLIKRNQLGFTFLLSLSLLRRILGGMRRATSAKRCSASGLVTNLGIPLSGVSLPRRAGRVVVGNLVLESVEAIGPNRPHQCVAFLLLTYADMLCVTLSFDSRVLPADDAQELVDIYVDRINESIRNQC